MAIPICYHRNLNQVLVQCICVILKSKIQPFNSHFQFQEQPKEYLARIMETATEQVEHKVDHGKVKTEEDIDIIAICQF